MLLENIFRNKRVLITGHTGFKGSWLSLWLTELGADVAGYSKSTLGPPSHFEVAGLESRLKRHYLHDIRDAANLEKCFADFRPEIVFHLAAEALVKDCFNDPRRAFETNVMGTVNVLEALRKTPSVRAAVIVTSDKCYENVEWEYGYRETDRLGGKDPYSASKACAELAFYTFFKSYFSQMDNINVATARAGNVIGGGDWAANRVVPDCVRSWSAQKTLILRSPHATRPWQHVLEPLGGYLKLASELYRGNPQVRGESFNFGPPFGTSRSVLDLIGELAKNKAWTYTTHTVQASGPAEVKEANLLQLSIDKAQNRLEWTTQLNFTTTAAWTSQWYSTYYKNAKEAAKLSLEQVKAYQTFCGVVEQNTRKAA